MRLFTFSEPLGLLRHSGKWLAVGWVYLQVGQSVEAGNNLLIDEIHRPQSVIPLRMAPLILVSTVISHLFGACATTHFCLALWPPSWPNRCVRCGACSTRITWWAPSAQSLYGGSPPRWWLARSLA